MIRIRALSTVCLPLLVFALARGGTTKAQDAPKPSPAEAEAAWRREQTREFNQLLDRPVQSLEAEAAMREAQAAKLRKAAASQREHLQSMIRVIDARTQDALRPPPADAEAAKQLEADALRLQEEIRARIIEADANRLGFDPPTQGLGVLLTPANETLRAQLALPDGRGWVVEKVVEDSPAAKIGIKPKDVLLTLDDQPLRQAADLDWRLKEIKDKPANLTLIRAGKPMSIMIGPDQVAEKLPGRWLGVSVGTVDDVLRSHLDLPEGQGVVVMEVVPGSPADKAGVKPHDVLLSLDDKPLTDIKSLIARVKDAGDQAVSLKILRAGKPMTLQATPEPRPKDMAAAFLPGQPFVPGTLRAIRPGVIFTPDGWRLPPPSPPMMRPGQGPQGGLAPTIAVRVADRPDRVEKLSAEILDQLKELRKAVDDLREAVKKDSDSKPGEIQPGNK